MTDACASHGDRPVDDPRGVRSVADVVADARAAQDSLASGSQETVDELTEVVHRLVCRTPGVSERWAGTAVAETEQGNVGDKVEKLEQVVGLTYEEMTGERSVGLVSDPSDDRLNVRKPVGVVGAHTPSTNCASTPVALALAAFKGGNALVVSPSPRAVETCDTIVDDVQDELEARGFPRRLVQSLSTPIRKDRTEELLTRADVIQVTGSPAQVEMGETCGTPNYCVGAGNTVGVVDPTADLGVTAEQIAHSAAFDNGLVCLCMSNVLVPPTLADELVAELAAAGGYVCSTAEVGPLRETLYDGDRIDSACIGQSAETVASMAGFGAELDGESFIVAPLGDVDLDDPLVGEDLSPVTALYEVLPEAAAATTNRITRHQGRGHSCAVYGDRDRAIELATRIDVCRISLNQSSIALSIGEHNRADTSLSLGCGTWGGNQTDGNITYEQFTNATTLYDRVGSDSRSSRHASDRERHGPVPDSNSASESDPGSKSGVIRPLLSRLGGGG
jgi:sulfoacetaldehyde dehydrogenase